MNNPGVELRGIFLNKIDMYHTVYDTMCKIIKKSINNYGIPEKSTDDKLFHGAF